MPESGTFSGTIYSRGRGIFIVMQQQPLDDAAPHERVRPPLPPIILLGLGAIICVLNLAGIVSEGGEFFFAPGLGFLSLLLFAAGAITSGILWRRRRAWAGWLTLLGLVGAVLSIILACAGLPKR
jgi:hypothetical protein